MGIHSKVWGQYLWRLLHTLTYSYHPTMPEELRGKYVRFFHVLKDFIPCPVCRNHYTDRIMKNPPEKNMKTTDDFVSWLNNLHNEVNAGLGKPLISKKYADTMYIRDGKLTYDFKDFVTLFRIISIMRYINYPAVRKFLQLLFEIYPDRYLYKNAPKSHKSIETIQANESMNIWIIYFDNEFAKNRKTRTYLNIELDPYNLPKEQQYFQSTQKNKEQPEQIATRENTRISRNLSERHSSKLIRDEVSEFLKKYQII